MAAVIVFYSMYNNTKAAAEYLAEKIDAPLVRLQGKGAVNPVKGMMKISANPVGDPWSAVRDADRMILMAPIYAFNGVPEVRGFLKNADLSGKDVLIITNGAAPEEKFSAKVAAQYTELIEKTGGKVSLNLHHIGGEYKQFSGNTHAHQQIDGILSLVQAWLARA
jgi:hypothetical protein